MEEQDAKLRDIATQQLGAALYSMLTPEQRTATLESLKQAMDMLPNPASERVRIIEYIEAFAVLYDLHANYAKDVKGLEH